MNGVSIKRYKQVTDVHRVQIDEIKLDEIIELGPECQFPPELLQETPLPSS